MLIPPKRWMIVAALPLMLLAALILLNTGFAPQRAWAQTESGIVSPAPGSTVSGVVTIIGTAVSENFDRYELAYKPEPSGEEAYAYLGEGREQVFGGQLGLWQTDDLAPGQYSLRMRVVRTDGNYTEYFVTNLTVGEEVEEPTPTPEEIATPIPATPTPIPAQPTPAVQPTATPIVQATAVVTPATETTVVTETVTLTETVEMEVEATPGLTPISVNVVGGDEASLRILLRAILASFTIGPATGAVTATVGALPTLPINLTLPPSVAVVGSVVRTGDFGGTQIFYAAPASAVNLVEDVGQQLSAQGFTVPQAMGSPGAVFLPSQPALSILCSPAGDLFVNLGAAALNNTVMLQISLKPIGAGGDPCSPDPMQAMGPGGGILPQLQPLAGAQVQGSGSSSGGDRISATADIQTELTADVVAAHYEDQLEEAGWERLEDTAADAIAWSAWRFTDDDGNDWNGTFYIVRLAGDGDSYAATLDAQRQR
ncbi:MAG: hypothetical protein KF893_17925 [Caldilineaceae bacterium]|nr:hypothetical protein [Caldilineaceae bacterium]